MRSKSIACLRAIAPLYKIELSQATENGYLDAAALGLFVELTGEIADFFGQRSKGFEGKLQNAKRVAFQALKTLAVQQDANAVVGIDMDYTEFSGNRIGLIVNGTLVRTVPI
jgi:uncharacterized protein YbjQ (UPF0145 family)